MKHCTSVSSFVQEEKHKQHSANRKALYVSMQDFHWLLLTSGETFKARTLSQAPANFLARAMAGCTSLVFVYPLDIAHTCLAAADIGHREGRQFQGILHFIQTIYKKDGLKGLYSGFPASVPRHGGAPECLFWGI